MFIVQVPAEKIKRNSESDSEQHDLSEHDPHYDPIVELPLVEIVTNEEEEEELVKIRARLYRYDVSDHEWKVFFFSNLFNND